MPMRIQLSIVVGALIVIGVLGVTAFNVRGTAAQPAPSVFLPFVANQFGSPTPTATATPTPTQTPGPSVSLVNFMFLPTSLHVSVGTTVVWTNTTPSTQHTVTSDTLVFDSGVLNPGLKFS